jgi:hypothetical protein
MSNVADVERSLTLIRKYIHELIRRISTSHQIMKFYEPGGKEIMIPMEFFATPVHAKRFDTCSHSRNVSDGCERKTGAASISPHFSKCNSIFAYKSLFF